MTPIPLQATPTLTPEGLRRLCEFLYVRTGMQFGETKRYYIERRVFERMEQTASRSFDDYFALLRADAPEAGQLVNAFTINETYFYREEHQLRALTQDILPELARQRSPGDKIRIWSQPCSTGEEAYSLAIWLLENWPLVDAYNVEIVGSDIDTAALDAARQGAYGARALSRLPPEALKAYFEPLARGARQIIQDLRESVTFTSANLVDEASMAAHGTFDVIFCRNVLIYFDDASRERAARHLFDALAPGGFICLGHTESMARIDARFEARRFTDAIIYQRPRGR